MRQARICTEPGPFGSLAVVWSVQRARPRVLRIFLSKQGLTAEKRASVYYPDARPASCREVDGLVRRMLAFLEGKDIRFELDPVRMDLCSPFQQRVLRAEHAIPRGRVSTYGRLAMHLGIQKGARAVGNCLATNPFPIIVPCHRAIRSDRTLGGYQGGIDMKRRLLEMEGIHFDPSGRVLVSDFFY